MLPGELGKKETSYSFSVVGFELVAANSLSIRKMVPYS